MASWLQLMGAYALNHIKTDVKEGTRSQFLDKIKSDSKNLFILASLSFLLLVVFAFAMMALSFLVINFFNGLNLNSKIFIFAGSMLALVVFGFTFVWKKSAKMLEEYKAILSPEGQENTLPSFNPAMHSLSPLINQIIQEHEDMRNEYFRS